MTAQIELQQTITKYNTNSREFSSFAVRPFVKYTFIFHDVGLSVILSHEMKCRRYTKLQTSASVTTVSLMPRLHQDTCRQNMYPGRTTCICIRIHIFMSTDTCRLIQVARPGYLYLEDIITIHLCHGRLVFLCNRRATNWRQFCRRYKKHVDGNKCIQLVSILV